MKLTKKWVVVAMVSVGLLTACGKSEEKTKESGKAEKVIIGTLVMPNDEGIAKAENYFEEEMGVPVEVKVFDAGRDTATAMMTEDIDFGLMGSSSAALSIAQGVKLEYIWTHEILGSVESLVAKPGIESAKDLVGKKIATPFSSTAHFSLLKYLEMNNIEESSVSLVDMQTAEIYTAWESNQIDAAYIWEPTLSQLTDKTVLATSEDLANEGFMTANVEVVTETFAKKHPELVEAYIRAVDKAVRLYQENEDEAVNIIAEALDLTPEDAKFQMNGSKWLNSEEQLAPEYMGTTGNIGELSQNLYDLATFLKAQGSISEVPEISVFEEAINPSYIEKLK
ncbi:ABC transporter substrate-binding protein [Enterococcus saccharolyticus]|uniref:taurine ABC transporter substrate-binding protein n=1 Tax=Enterococcus saccharolyticus TaxID=41997 RepID=UPI0039E02199